MPEHREVLRLPEDSYAVIEEICGVCDAHLELIAQQCDVVITHRGNEFFIRGAQRKSAVNILQKLYAMAQKQDALLPADVHLVVREVLALPPGDALPAERMIQTRQLRIASKNRQQAQYMDAIDKNDINFGVGPAGTGKTFLAVASAVSALEADKVRRIVLVRPAVEAGENLGFLPGDLEQKIEPYLRPLYDALYEMLGFETVAKLIDRRVIEVAPLAYMRGRTLNEAFIILDEAQNTTNTQMKMFLTRLGFGSTAVITGDLTQVDLARGQAAGLGTALSVLENVKGVNITHFSAADAVRHPLVQRIIQAYEAADG